MRSYLHAKLHGLTVTEANLDYDGSITLPMRLISLVNLHEHQQVDVLNCSNGSRLTTYVNAGNDDKTVGINGAAAPVYRSGSHGIECGDRSTSPSVNSPSTSFWRQLACLRT